MFISYAREDADDVDNLVQRFLTAGIPVWRDADQLWPGDNWQAKIHRAIVEDAVALVACFSNQSLARSSRYQNEELALAVEQARLLQPEVPWLIPARFDECQIPDRDIGGRRLATIQRADLFGKQRERETSRLVEAVKRIMYRRI